MELFANGGRNLKEGGVLVCLAIIVKLTARICGGCLPTQADNFVDCVPVSNSSNMLTPKLALILRYWKLLRRGKKHTHGPRLSKISCY